MTAQTIYIVDVKIKGIGAETERGFTRLEAAEDFAADVRKSPLVESVYGPYRGRLHYSGHDAAKQMLKAIENFQSLMRRGGGIGT